jgi:hypothetical protein
MDNKVNLMFKLVTDNQPMSFMDCEEIAKDIFKLIDSSGLGVLIEFRCFFPRNNYQYKELDFNSDCTKEYILKTLSDNFEYYPS